MSLVLGPGLRARVQRIFGLLRAALKLKSTRSGRERDASSRDATRVVPRHDGEPWGGASVNPKRPITDTSRDVFVRKTPPRSFAVPEPIEDEVTGKCEGDDLARLRGKRPTDERVSRLETKHDKLDDKVDAIDSKMSRMEGKLDTALAFITDRGQTQRTLISTNGKIIIAIVTSALATIGTVLAAVLS
jgi:hypothetical protein